MHSCLYEGQVSHRRYVPKCHAFTYRIFYLYMDLDELDRVFSGRWFWSTRRFALAWFREVDHISQAERSLKQTVCDVVEKHTGERPQGPVRLLTQLRYFGYVFNPVSFYYCFDKDDTHVETIVAEVNNTPWGERHLYVLPNQNNISSGRHMRFQRSKEFHVSPFMPMDIQYDWVFSSPGKYLSVNMKNYRNDENIFDATLGLKRKPINAINCAHVLLRYPFMTLKVIVAIYWQALILLVKGIPVFNHPGKIKFTRGGADKA